MLTDFGVHRRTPVTEKLPPVPDFADEVQVEIRNHHLVLVLTAFYHDFAARVDKVSVFTAASETFNQKKINKLKQKL